MGGGGGARGGGGGGFRGGGGGGSQGFSGGARAFSAPRAQSFGGFRGGATVRAPGMGVARAPGFNGSAMRAPGYGAARAPMSAASRTFAPGRSGFGGMGARAPIGNAANRINSGNFRSFGNTGFGGVARGNTGFGSVARASVGVGGIRGGGLNRAGGLAGATNLTSYRVNNFGSGLGYRGYGYGNGSGLGYRGYGYGWRNPYYGYHNGWLGGYWGGYSPWGFGYGWGYPYYGWGLGYGMGYGMGWGLWNWGYGSALYGYGYTPYTNAYYAPTTVAMVPYDYSQPINTTLGAPPAESATDDALALFGSARDAFKQGSYESALRMTDDALAKTPNDTALHEFRALCLFAQRRYDEAATALYAVLSVGPGWDWPTLIGLYPNIDVYTTQLRALEAYCSGNPRTAVGRFVLAYHYLADGSLDAAAADLKQVVTLKPDDTISSRLLQQIEASRQGTAASALPAPPPPGGGAAPGAVTPAPGGAVAPAPGGAIAPPPGGGAAPGAIAPPAGATLDGTWTARPTPDTTIVLTIRPGGTFDWQVTQKGQTQKFSGASTFGAGVLTLTQEKGPVMVGRVTWQDASHLTFRVIGGGPDDHGLSFSR
jgi:hypothetical protein